MILAEFISIFSKQMFTIETGFVLLSCDLGSESDIVRKLKHIESVRD